PWGDGGVIGPFASRICVSDADRRVRFGRGRTVERTSGVGGRRKSEISATGVRRNGVLYNSGSPRREKRSQPTVRTRPAQLLDDDTEVKAMLSTFAMLAAALVSQPAGGPPGDISPEDAARFESKYLANIRQVTDEGQSGE